MNAAEHRTSNIEHPTSKRRDRTLKTALNVQCSMFDVRCFPTLRPAIALAICALLPACPGPKPGLSKITPTPTPSPTATPPPTPTPTPTPIVIPYKRMETAKMWSGIKVRATVEADYGRTATVERETPDSYTLDLRVSVKVPKPHTSLAELAKLNPQLATVLPGLESMLATAKPSEFFDSLYKRKVATIHGDLTRLEELISRHNFYDCETLLELQHPTTKRRALLLQAEMDVVTDGSDGDRIAPVDSDSTTFQPTTSYKWPKQTAHPNPFLTIREQRLRDAQAALASGTLTPQRAKELRDAMPVLRAKVEELKRSSFLLAAADPFVVLPLPLFSQRGPFAPQVGDYAVVIFGGVAYPAIVGDAGPTYKVGEASLRICKQINELANGRNRPVNDLKATYLVFPQTAAKPFGPPNLALWHQRCAALLNEIGGCGGTLFQWNDITTPPPTPTPVPTPTPWPTPTPFTTGTTLAGTPAPLTTGTATPTATPAASGTPAPSPSLVPIKPTLKPKTTPTPITP
jgi:hypothetical protein